MKYVRLFVVWSNRIPWVSAYMVLLGGLRPKQPHQGLPKGYLAVYVGDKMRRFRIPVSCLNQPLIISRIT